MTTIVALMTAWWLDRRESHLWRIRYESLKRNTELYDTMNERMSEAFQSFTSDPIYEGAVSELEEGSVGHP